MVGGAFGDHLVLCIHQTVGGPAEDVTLCTFLSGSSLFLSLLRPQGATVADVGLWSLLTQTNVRAHNTEVP